MYFEKPWDFVENCFLKKGAVLSNSNQWQGGYHPIVRLLSFFPDLLSTMADIAKFQSGIPDHILGCLLYHIPKKEYRIPRSSKYISAKSTEEEDTPELETIKKVYCLNTKHGKQVVQILRQQKVNLGEKGRKRKNK